MQTLHTDFYTGSPIDFPCIYCAWYRFLYRETYRYYVPYRFLYRVHPIDFAYRLQGTIDSIQGTLEILRTDFCTGYLGDTGIKDADGRTTDS